MKTPFGARFLRVLCLIVAGASPAWAQGSLPPDTLVVPLEGVTITGARTAEAMRKTPAAVSLVTRERFTPTRQISLADGLARVPGVFAQSRGGAQDVRITIRGYGARGNGERSNSGNMRGIRVMTDGIPLTEPDGRTSLEFVDLGSADRVEVLRSNGSVLYGNAAGGVVHVRTTLDFERPFLELQARGGSFGFHREQAVAGYRIGSAHATTSLYNSTFDGWREHSGSSTTSLQNRIGVPLSERSRLGVILDYVANLNRYPGALTAAQLEADPEQANPTFVARDERRYNRVGRVGLTLDQGLGAEQTLSLATWVEPKVLQRSERNRFRDFTRYHVGGSATWQMPTTLAPSVRAVWMAGLDEQFQDGSIQFYDVALGGGRGTSLLANQREAAHSAGAFAQGELSWNERWSLRLAARYDHLWYISHDRIEPRLNATTTFTQLTPKAALAYYLDRHTLYASAGGGVESPAFNEIDPPAPYDTLTSLNPFLDPMRSESFEVGAKGELASDAAPLGRLRYDVALYWIRVENDIVPFDGGAYYFTAGESQRRGVELGLDWTPVSPLTLSGALTLSENEYETYVNDLGDFSGSAVAGLPGTLFDGEVRWRPWPLVSLALNLRRVGRYYADDANTARVDAATVIGAEAEAAWAMPFGVLKAFVAGDNLADEDYVSSVFINGVNGQYYEPGLPANVSVGVRLTLR